MSRKKKPLSKPSNAYLISFGDTMTAMLAFFIVLNTLAKEQTGVNLHSGTGSFVTSLNSMGLPGLFSGKRSKRVAQGEDAAPNYIVNHQPQSPRGQGDGPDDESNSLRVIDRKKERFQRLLIEMEQQFDVQSTDEEASEVAFDLFQPLGQPPKSLPTDARRVLARSMMLLRRPNYRLEIVLWSPTPSRSAVTRTARQAKQVKAEILGDFSAMAARPESVTAAARLWPHSDDRRPVLTVKVVKARERQTP